MDFVWAMMVAHDGVKVTRKEWDKHSLVFVGGELRWSLDGRTNQTVRMCMKDDAWSLKYEDILAKDWEVA